MNRVRKEYIENVRPALMKKFAYKSIMEAPKIEKIIVNMESATPFTTRSCLMPPLMI